ncbi:MAG: ABC transporter permease subunit [Nitrososphaerota archaeon]|nr:ABC transporter permease subunit [Nitrososphaerota archaeon]
MVVGAGSEFAGFAITGKEVVTGGSVSLLADPRYSLHTCGMIFIWAGLGYNALILLSGMSTIPKEYYEAAELDGATGFACF